MDCWGWAPIPCLETVAVQHQRHWQGTAGSWTSLPWCWLVLGRLSASKGHAVIFTSFKSKTKPRHKKTHLDLKKKNNQNDLLTKQLPAFGLELVSPALFAPRLCLWRAEWAEQRDELTCTGWCGAWLLSGDISVWPCGPWPCPMLSQRGWWKGLSLTPWHRRGSGLSGPREHSTWCQTPS